MEDASQLRVKNPALPPNKFTEWKHAHRALNSSSISDEYARYCDSPTSLDTDDARKWWLEGTQQRIYPNLSKMALDILSIPAMSAEPERVFSSIGIQLTNRRNKM